MPSWFKRYLLPGVVFQSIIIAGGYGTGRELVEFFLEYGVVGGLIGMIPATILVSLTCMVGFEFARAHASYDYRSYFRHLLGRGWFSYEIGYLTALMLILAVIGAAAGTFLSETFGLPGWVGAAGLLLAIGALVFKGTPTIERFFAGWSFLLYGAYLALFAWSIAQFGDQIAGGLAGGEIRAGWFSSGVRYAALLVALVPAMLFATRHIRERREALWAGALAGPIAMIPGVLFYLALAGSTPACWIDRFPPTTCWRCSARGRSRSSSSSSSSARSSRPAPGSSTRSTSASTACTGPATERCRRVSAPWSPWCCWWPGTCCRASASWT